MSQQGSMSDANFALRRAALGICSLGLLVAAGGVYSLRGKILPVEVSWVFLRMGMVLATIWLALPELRGLLKSFSVKGILCMLVALLLAATRPGAAYPLMILGVPVLAVFGLKRGWQWLREPVSVAKRPASGSPQTPSSTDSATQSASEEERP